MRTHKLTRTVLATLGVLAAGLLFSAPAALAASAPSVQGENVSSLTPFEARLEATVNAGEEPTECHFQYGKTSVTEHEAACEGQLPLVGGEQSVGLTVSGLAAATAYHYQVLVKNAIGEAKGTAEEFTTLTAERPIVESEGVSTAQSTTATLEAQVNPDYQKTTYKFEYATSKNLAGAKTVTGTSELEGYGGQTASTTVSGLQPGENYYYRVIATNATGTSSGVTPAQSFTTLPVPSTGVPTDVTGTGATFNGHFTLTPQDTRWFFVYARNGTCMGENSTPVIDAGTGTSLTSPEWSVPSGETPGVYGPAAPLYPGSQYRVCFVTANAFGSQVGPEMAFTTPPTPPTITSESAPDITTTQATLEALINPNLQETSYLFQYATKTNGATLENPTTVNGAAPLPGELRELSVSAQIAGLDANTTYYYRVLAANATPLTEDGPIQTLLTFPNTPTTGSTSRVTESTATIMGTVNPGSDGRPAGHDTAYYFQYGNDEAYGQQTLSENAGEGPNPIVETAALSGLLPGRTYHYRVVASDENNGTEQFSYGQDQTFTTAGTPVVLTPPSNGSGQAPPQSTSSTSTAIMFPSLATITSVPLVKEPGETHGSEPKSLTRGQKLTKALNACKKVKGARRARCKRQARSKYGKTTKKKGK
jgi:phosphodiesterase/alkaline phosphatase D-like protein